MGIFGLIFRLPGPFPGLLLIFPPFWCRHKFDVDLLPCVTSIVLAKMLMFPVACNLRFFVFQ